MKPTFLSALGLALFCAAALSPAAPHDHGEFDATLFAPFRGQPVARTFFLSFDYPGLRQPRMLDWQLELRAPDGRLVRRWRGARRLAGPLRVPVRWDGRGVADGLHTVHLRAVLRGGGTPQDTVEQQWQIAVGRVRADPAPALAAVVPYAVYLGNLHSQTNHSDGGAPLDACTGAQAPQTGRDGPAEAFAYARGRGLDVLLTSEHNHMYDGSDGTNAAADPATARALYRAGRQAAAAFSAAHPGFLALYGQEWGVIANGGHLNVFNAPELLGWEKNAKGELLADTPTPRGDYAGLYTLMRARGWIGQFNHPAQQGQFMVNGVPLAYTADGDAAMVLCEVVNSSAFSTNDSETETRRSNFEAACNRLLEAGYHLAFSSNQDNHCANWGAAYTNRTGVLLPHGVALTEASFMDALRARRVFATMDKTGVLSLTANGQMMGARFDNDGPLTLEVQFASSAGKALAAVAIMEGVPGRNGTVTALSSSAVTTITPTPGAHFYYARVTQEDGNVLWSAPVWVKQRASEPQAGAGTQQGGRTQ